LKQKIVAVYLLAKSLW